MSEEDKIVIAIMRLPIVEKYRSKYFWAIHGGHSLSIPLENARKNYFIKTIKTIAKIPRVKRVFYSKAQDKTVSDTLEIFFYKRGEE